MYHQLLVAFFNAGLQIETEHRDWVLPIRIRMMDSQRKGVTTRVLYFYFTIISCLVVIGIISIWHIEQISRTIWPLLISAATVAVLGLFHWKMKGSAINKEAGELLEKYEKSEKIGLEVKLITIKPNYIAPDGSEIRTLLQFPSGGLAQCTLPPGATTQAVKLRSVVEVWYVIAGEGEIWRKLDEAETLTSLIPGTSINIPIGTHFQFRNTGAVPLEILLSTMPAWPGPEEAVVVENIWPLNIPNLN